MVIGNLIIDDLHNLWVFTGEKVVLLSQLDDPESGYFCNGIIEAIGVLKEGGYLTAPREYNNHDLVLLTEAYRTALVSQDLAKNAVGETEMQYRLLMESVQRDMDADPDVIRAREEKAEANAYFQYVNDALRAAIVAVAQQTGTKTREVVGFKLQANESTKYDVVNPLLCVEKAIEEKAASKVFKSVKVSPDKKLFEGWIALKDKPGDYGVEVRTEWGSAITPPKEP